MAGRPRGARHRARRGRRGLDRSRQRERAAGVLAGDGGGHRPRDAPDRRGPLRAAGRLLPGTEGGAGSAPGRPDPVRGRRGRGPTRPDLHRARRRPIRRGAVPAVPRRGGPIERSRCLRGRAPGPAAARSPLHGGRARHPARRGAGGAAHRARARPRGGRSARDPCRGGAPRARGGGAPRARRSGERPRPRRPARHRHRQRPGDLRRGRADRAHRPHRLRRRRPAARGSSASRAACPPARSWSPRAPGPAPPRR